MGGTLYEVQGQSESSRLKDISLLKELQFTFKNDIQSQIISISSQGIHGDFIL